MQYLLLIYDNEKNMMSATPAQMKTMMDEYNSFTQSIVSSGNFKAGDALQPVGTAKTVRVRNGEVMTTDGPFAETREQLGGYYLVEAKSMEEAIGIAKRIPAVHTGSIEVRPIQVFE